ncbi:MAG: hypothetical protein ACRCZA_00095 [Shewanella sp.]|uniref:hypothetical protein n=1 Tax=Shewanella sp. TaxID=50422 RepID=UPI003F3F5E8E
MASEPSRGVLLARYFDQRALSMISASPSFRLGAVLFGYGFVDDSVNPPLVDVIPITATKNDITAVYTDTSPTYFYNAQTHQINIRCEIPAGAAGIPANGANVNVACILDEQGQAVAMLAGQPSTVNKDRGYVVTGIIESNIN